MGKMVGIDLGTTNSVVAIVDGPQPRVLDNRDAKSQTRSIVSLKKRKGKVVTDEELLVGDTAMANWPMAPEDTIISVKRLMGRAVGDVQVQRVREWAEYKVVLPSDGTKDSVRILLGGKEYSPIDISALILRKLKEDSEFRLGDKVTHAVITVPAYFSERQRDATRKAGLKAGLKVMKVLDEPTAAAYAFGVDAGGGGEPKTLLVYDLGGGTFDISVLMWAGNVFAPLNLEGDMWLGGDDFDQVLVDRVVQHVKDEYGIDPTADKRFMAHLRMAARETKERLSNARSADLILAASHLKDSSGDPIDIQMEISREEYEQMIKPLVDRTVSLTEKALKNANYAPDQIDYVLMAGNSTCVPMVQQAVEKIFGPEKVLRKIHPKHCVAIGAALLAARLKGVVCQAPDKADPKQQCGHVNLLDANTCTKCGASLELEEQAAPALSGVITEPIVVLLGEHVGIAPFSYGTQSAGDKFNVFIKKSEPYPTGNPHAMTFYTAIPNARIISIPVYGGDHIAKASANELQGQAFAILPSGLPQDTPVRIKLWLDSDGVFQLSAHLENALDLKPWILRGEADSKAIEALQVAEQKMAQKAEFIPPEKRRDFDKARESVFDEIRKGDYEQALHRAQNLEKLIDDIRERGEQDLSTKAENLIGYAEYLLHRYGWAFDPNHAYQINKIVEETRRALEGGNRAALQKKINEIDKATDVENLPTVVQGMVGISMAIAARIRPVDPGTAGKLLHELEEIEQAYKADDRSATKKFNAFAEKVIEWLKDHEGARPQAQRCSVCGKDVAPGAQYCPAGHDNWILKDKSTSSSLSR